jgi:hypothetical protein
MITTITKTHFNKALVIMALMAGMAMPNLKAQEVVPAVADNVEPAVVAEPAEPAVVATPVVAPADQKKAPIIGLEAGGPNDRIFIKPHVWSGYNIGKHQSGWGYGAGIRVLYDCNARFLGGSVFFGTEVSYMAPLAFVPSSARPTGSDVAYNKQNYLVLPLILEQNYPLFKSSFTLGTGVAYYKGIQGNRQNAVGLITNIGWFPIYKGKAITPQITYRNDWVFDANQTNTQSICLALNF